LGTFQEARSKFHCCWRQKFTKKNYFCVTINIVILLSVSFTSTMHIKIIVAFQLQQVRQSTIVLRYTYVEYLVFVVRRRRQQQLSALPLALCEMDKDFGQDFENKKQRSCKRCKNAVRYKCVTSHFKLLSVNLTWPDWTISERRSVFNLLIGKPAYLL